MGKLSHSTDEGMEAVERARLAREGLQGDASFAFSGGCKDDEPKEEAPSALKRAELALPDLLTYSEPDLTGTISVTTRDGAAYGTVRFDDGSWVWTKKSGHRTLPLPHRSLDGLKEHIHQVCLYEARQRCFYEARDPDRYSQFVEED